MSEYANSAYPLDYEEPVPIYEIIEDIEPTYYDHYIHVNEHSHIDDFWSSGPPADKTPPEGYILMTDKGGYHFRLWPDGEENPPLFTEDMIPLYWLDGKTVRTRSPEDIEAERAARAQQPRMPTTEEQLAAMAAAIMEMAGEIYG